LHTRDASDTDKAAGILLLYWLPEALPHRYAGSSTDDIGYNSYILAFGVVKGPLVRRGYIFGWRQDSKEEGYKEEGERIHPDCI
jgi:hypothetical protein